MRPGPSIPAEERKRIVSTSFGRAANIKTYRIPPVQLQDAVGPIIDLVTDDRHKDDIQEEDDGRYYRRQESNGQGGQRGRTGDGAR